MHCQGHSTPAGTCHACQYLTEDGVMADPSGLRSQDGSGYLFHDVATPGRRMGQLPLSRSAGTSGSGRIAQPLAIKIDSGDRDGGGDQAPAGGYPVVIRGKGCSAAFERSGGETRAPVAVLRPITALCGNDLRGYAVVARLGDVHELLALAAGGSPECNLGAGRCSKLPYRASNL